MIATQPPPPQHRTGSGGLAFKAYEIEELADVYFFRPIGIVVAQFARLLTLTPNQLSVVATIIGIAGGCLLFKQSLALLGFGLLMLHGLLDSADGQLARLTGQTTELGKALDSLSGHLTYVAIYIAITAAVFTRSGSSLVFVLAVLAAVSNFVHAQFYVYFRAAYQAVVIEGLPPGEDIPQIKIPWLGGLVRIYERIRGYLIGWRGEIESLLRARSVNGTLLAKDRARYRTCFYWPVRGWNFLGDNTRFYAIGLLAWFHHLDWFFPFIVGPMNVALVVLWFWQRHEDRHFLAEM
jgi:hypothetical protein